jgi:hypothetical protein
MHATTNQQTRVYPTYALNISKARPAHSAHTAHTTHVAQDADSYTRVVAIFTNFKNFAMCNITHTETHTHNHSSADARISCVRTEYIQSTASFPSKRK